MELIYLLHFYQPDFQFREILEEVYNKSYKKVFKIIKDSPNAKIAINITASTIEKINNYNAGDIIRDLKSLYKTGRVEFTATSLAHVLLSEATYEQALRQIKLDIEKKSYFLDIPEKEFKVLFPPELSINPQVLKLAKNLGIEGLIVSHNSIENFKEGDTTLLNSNQKIFVRSLKVSRMLESENTMTSEEFLNIFQEQGLETNGLYLAAHDVEIIGFRFEKKLKLFKEILNNPKIKLVSFDQILKMNKFKSYNGKLLQGTWEKILINDELSDVHWNNPENKIHKYQWKLSNLIINQIEKFPEINTKSELQIHLDYIQYSCQYWWASSYPYWSAGIISNAAWSWLYLAYKVYYALKMIDKEKAERFINQAKQNYMRLIETLTEYDITKWHEKNIHYYDQNIHSLKLSYKL